MDIYQQILRGYKLPFQVIPELIPRCSNHINFVHPKWGKELGGVEDDLDPTEDGEASEETHCSSDEAKLGFQGHLLVFFHFVIGGCVVEDLDEVDLCFVWWG